MARILMHVLAAAMVVWLTSSKVVADEPLEVAMRKDAWRKKLDGVQYRIPDHYSGLLASLRKFSADAKIHVIFDPKDKWSLEFKFVCDGREILSLRGHVHSAFTSFDNTLFFAEYPTDSTGCIVLAYDLSTGKKLWETKLRGPKPVGHSGYANSVTIRMSNAGEVNGEPAGAAIVITGSESYTDYVEVLDRQTGTSLAVKNYRIGFGPPPPPGGGFDGRTNDNPPHRSEVKE